MNLDGEKEFKGKTMKINRKDFLQRSGIAVIDLSVVSSFLIKTFKSVKALFTILWSHYE